MGGVYVINNEDKIKSEDLNGVYKEFAEILGYEVTVLIYNYFKGLQITFPTKLLSREYVKKKVLKEYNGTNLKFLARKFNYSERWLRNILTTEKNKKE